MKLRFRRPLSLLLATVMLLGLLPTAAFAAPGESTIALSGIGNLRDYQQNRAAGKSENYYDYVWYGGLKWRVLDTEAVADEDAGDEGVLLLSENVLNYGQPWNGYRMYSDRNGNGTTDGDTTMGYHVSDIRAYLTGEGTYTKFRTGRSVNASEVTYSTPTYYYYRAQVSSEELKAGPKDDTQYYLISGSPNYLPENSNSLNATTFQYGQYYIQQGDGYAISKTYEEDTTYYYDASVYEPWSGTAFTENTDYYTFYRVTGVDTTRQIDSAILGTIYYVGYQTTGSNRPETSSVTRTIVSGQSAEDTNLAKDYGFSQVEQKAVLPATRTGSNVDDKYYAGSYTYYGGSLDGDTYFLLAADEANSVEYGLNLTSNRIGRLLNGTTSAYWWLRTACYTGSPGDVTPAGSGYYSGYATGQYVGVRPAFYLDSESVLFTSAAEGGKSSIGTDASFENPAPSGTQEWKLTLLDEGMGVTASLSDTGGDSESYTLSYSNASTYGNDVYLSAIITDGAGEQICGYAKLAAVDSTAAQSGTVTFTLPDGRTLDNCLIKVFLERCGDKEATDYASQPIVINEWNSDDAGHWRGDDSSNKKAHVFTAWTPDRDNCAEAGTETCYCTICGYKKEQSLAAGEHTLEHFEQKNADCDGGDSGVKEHWICEVCGGIYAQINNDGKAVENSRVDSLDELILNAAHDFQADYVYKPAEGEYASHYHRGYQHCINCGYDRSVDGGISGLYAHTGVACGKTGKCTACGYVYTSPREHTYHINKSTFLGYVDAHEPTCTETGLGYYTCLNEGCNVTGTATVPALGHLYSSWTTTVAPTYDSEGQNWHYCTRCQEPETQAIPALGRENATINITGNKEITWTGATVSAEHNSSTATFSYVHSGGATLTPAFTVTWYDNNNGSRTKRDAAPNDIGSYSLGVAASAVNQYAAVAETFYDFSIVKANQVKPTFSLSDDSVKMGETVTIQNLNSNYAQETPVISYTSSNTDVAKVDDSGNITLVGPGTTQITVTYQETDHYKSATSNPASLTVQALGTSKEITSFTLPGQVGETEIDGTSICITMPYNANLTSLTPTITHTGVGISPASGAAQNFSSPVTYTVEAEDGTSQAYTVTVTKQQEKLVSIDQINTVTLTSQYDSADAVIEAALPKTVTGTKESGDTVTLTLTWKLKDGETFTSETGGSNTYVWTATLPDGTDLDTSGVTLTGEIRVNNQGGSRTPQGSVTGSAVVLSADTSQNTTTLTMTVTTENPGTLTYRWQKYGDGKWSDIQRKTESTLTLNNLTFQDNGTQYRCVVTHTETGLAPASGNFTCTLSVSRGNQEKPNAVFNAGTVTLSNVDSGMEYRIGTSGEWTKITGATQDLSGTVTHPCTIQIRRAETEFLNSSEVQTISVDKAQAPALTAVHPTAPGGNGSITGLTAGMEIKGSDGSWRDVTEADLTSLAPGTYEIRFKASGNTLASDTRTVTIKARYSVTVSGVSDHVTVSNVPTTAGVLAGDSFTFSVTPDSGYTVTVAVTGMSSSNVTQAQSITVSDVQQDITITLTSRATTYTVQFDTSGGSSHTPITVTPGGTYPELPTPTKDGCRFEGWYLDNDTFASQIQQGDTVTSNDNHTLYAKWYEKQILTFNTIQKVTVPYDGSSHSVTPSATVSGGTTVVTDGFIVEYKLKDAANDAYTEESPSAVGEYMVRISRPEDNYYRALSAISDQWLTITAISGEEPSAAEATINYEQETISFDSSKYEMSSTNSDGGASIASGSSITGYISDSDDTTVYIRARADANHSASAWVAVTIPQRPAAPTGISASASTTADGQGSITGVNADQQYKLKSASGWTDVNGTTLNVAPGTYQVRNKASNAEKKFASQPAEVTVEAFAAPDLSDNANLSNLTVSNGSLSPAFASGTTNYTVTVPQGTTSITVTPTAEDGGATITVNGAAVTSGTASNSITLENEMATITIVVTAEDGTTTKTYTVTVNTAQPDTYTVTISDGGTGATGAGSYSAGDTVTIYAGTKDGFTFKNWESSDVTITAAGNVSISFTMPSKNVTVTANWTENQPTPAETITVIPADIIIYMGGRPYEGAVDAGGNIISDEDAGLPEPGFTVQLPDTLRDKDVTDLTFKEKEGSKTWTFQPYDGQDGTTVYKLVPAKGQEATKVQFIDPDTNTAIPSDEFIVGLEVNKSFGIELYRGSGDSQVGEIVVEVDGKEYAVATTSGTLTVRGTTSQAEFIGVSENAPSGGKAGIVADSNTTYTINDSDVQVVDTSGVSLLFDEIIDTATTNRTSLLQSKAESYFETNGETPEAGNRFAYEFKYLDLVDANNGNAWVKASDDVTIYWPIPAGADETSLQVLHFKGLHRDMSTGQIADEIEKCEVETITPTVQDGYVSFTVSSAGFSPFALVWQEAVPANSHTITATAGAGGTISPNGSVYVADGADQTFTFYPNSNYAVSSVTVDGTPVSWSGNNYTFTNVTADHTIEVAFVYTGSTTPDPGDDDNDYTLYYHSNFGTDKSFYQSSASSRMRVRDYADMSRLPEREGYLFVCWNTEKDGSGEDYAPGDTFHMERYTDHLYAQWEKEAIIPGVADPDDTGVSSWLNTTNHRAFLSGYGGGKFGPNDNMTRAQVAQMFYNLLIDKNVPITVNFTDVPADAWYAEAVNTLGSLGIIAGIGNNQFAPERSITRAEFTVIAMRFTDLGLDGENPFSDVPDDAWYCDHVVRAAQYGWIGGYSDGTFRPYNTITRAEVTTIVNRMLGRAADKDYVDAHRGELTQFTDVSTSYWAYYQIMEATNAHDYDRTNSGEDWTRLHK